MTREILILMATAVPTQRLIDDLKNAIATFEENPSTKAEQRLVFHCQILAISFMIDGDIEKASKVASDMNKLDSIAKNFIDNDN